MTTGSKLSCTSLQEHNLKTFTRVPHAVGLVVAYHRRIEQLYAGDPETGLAHARPPADPTNSIRPTGRLPPCCKSTATRPAPR
jgi:hypothetical protein